jgi:hypothetical protein
MVLSEPLRKHGQDSKKLLEVKHAPRSVELRKWLSANPDIADESKRGFDDIRAGRYRRVSSRPTCN